VPEKNQIQENVGEVPLPVNIEAAREGLHTLYTSILCHPHLSELFLRLSALTIAIVGSKGGHS